MISKRNRPRHLEEGEEKFFNLIEKWYPYEPISDAALLTVFPEAKEVVIRLMKETSDEIQRITGENQPSFERALALIEQEPEDKKELSLLLARFTHFELPMSIHPLEGGRDRSLPARLERLSKIVRLHFLRQDMVGSPNDVNEETIAAAKNVHIEDLGVRPNQAGFIPCPFHNEKTPSCKISKNKFYCFGCHAHGDVIDWLQKTEDKSFRDAVVMLSGMVK